MQREVTHHEFELVQTVIRIMELDNENMLSEDSVKDSLERAYSKLKRNTQPLTLPSHLSDKSVIEG